MAPAAGYAPLCRESQTLEQIALWETSDARARRALGRLLDASGIEPPDTPLLAWSSVMGLVEAQAREDVTYVLEFALEAGTLAPGTAGFKRRQAELVADVLTQRAPQSDAHGDHRPRCGHARAAARHCRHVGGSHIRAVAARPRRGRDRADARASSAS
jgi:hypothetical protein